MVNKRAVLYSAADRVNTHHSGMALLTGDFFLLTMGLRNVELFHEFLEFSP